MKPILTALVVATCALLASPSLGQNTITMSASVRVADPTIHSIGFEWDLTGAANHTATSTLRYRPTGTSMWNDALPLLRIDYQGWYVRCCDQRCCGASPDARCSNGHADELHESFLACMQ